MSTSPIQLEVPGTQRFKASRFNHFHTLPTGEKLAYEVLPQIWTTRHDRVLR